MNVYKIYLIFFSLLMGCSASKLNHTSRETEALKAVMASKSFEFTADRVQPMATQSLNAVANAGLLPPGSNVGAIQINGTPNFLKIVGDSISGNLPYYGERRFGGGYGSSTGVEFEGIPSLYNQEYNEAKNRFDITLEISEKMESYRITLNIFPDRTTSVTVTSNQRNTIRYTGSITPLKTLPK